METDLDAPAKAAVRRAGTKAIPFLLEWLSSTDGYRAAWAFGALGPAAQQAIPDLARMATNVDYAIYALGRIGPPAIPALSVLATNRAIRRTGPRVNVIRGAGTNYAEPIDYPNPRSAAVQALADLGTNAIAAVPAFIECLCDEDSHVVATALSALRTLQVRQQAALVAERRVLNNTNAELRSYALYALAAFGEKALPDLLQALQDRDDVVASHALSIVADSAPQALTNAAVLAGAANDLRSPEPMRRRRAAQVLRAAEQGAQGRKPNLGLPMPGGWDRVLAEGTNALLRLAPELLTNAPAPERIPGEGAPGNR